VGTHRSVVRLLLQSVATGDDDYRAYVACLGGSRRHLAMSFPRRRNSPVAWSVLRLLVGQSRLQLQGRLQRHSVALIGGCRWLICYFGLQLAATLNRQCLTDRPTDR
jgi:hypothetical protein